MIMHHYEHIKISLLTKHMKEKVIAPKFLKMLNAEIIHTNAFDTDELGTFTRDKARYGNQLAAAMSSQSKIRNWKELAKFARLNKFPRHHLVLRPDDEKHPVFQKGISNRLVLEEAFNEAIKLSKTKKVYVEHDLRAHANPTRMKNIANATTDLINKLKSLCPNCHTPGFQITKVKPGLPCAMCGMQTRETFEKIFTCNICDYERSDFIKKHKADPSKCNFCNP